MSVGPAGWMFIVITCAGLPYVAIKSARRVQARGAMPSTRQRFSSALMVQAILLVVALLAARREWIALFPAPRLEWQHVLAALAFLAIALGTLPLRWSWKSDEERRCYAWLLPAKPSEAGWWVAASFVAGVVEEIAYRGVLLALTERLLGSWALAVALCVTVFALAHFVQGWRTMVVIAVLSAALHALVRATGGLHVTIVIHVLYDLVAGFLLWRLARRDGLLPAPPAVVL